jgi:hypothetical protein
LQAIELSSLLVLSAIAVAQGNEWIPVTRTEALQNYMSGMKAERKLTSGNMSRGEYHSDGTGTLYSWGASIPRAWTVPLQINARRCVKKMTETLWKGTENHACF